ncbi:hypothetical protein F4553_003408 [Allocatelliglobosispora scoriae]|uniref:Uncharacterized protein n=1 Tax=Allocatelliglobosispora scoriae TaxID=643052 RepID=A0A841BS58_9ACTN|nr:hypothetical protein [Allocatelliglobosispora scoriae]MBB5870029.1 hypothetical protein [Allocatelliglobosispora scoriae]
MTLRYLGNSPYCAANSLSVIFGEAGPGAPMIEVASGSPFGFSIGQVDGGHRRGFPDHEIEEIVFFSSPRWSPDFGLARSLDVLGWDCDRIHSSAEEAVAALRRASHDAPVLVGPLEMGLLPYFPGLGQAVGADHVLVGLGVEGDLLRAHDVIGWPFVTISLDDLLAAWQGDTFAYETEAYQVRAGFRQARPVATEEAVRRSMETAIHLLEAPEIAPAAQRAAELVEAGLTNMQYKYLVEFQVQAGARRLADAAVLFHDAGATASGAILEQQAKLVGSLQLLLMKHDDAATASVFRELGPTYGELLDALRKES